VPSLSANPYPWPYDGELDGGRLALVIAGGQCQFVDASYGSQLAAAAIAALADAVRSSGGWLVHLRHGRPLPSTTASLHALMTASMPASPAATARARPSVPTVASDGWQPKGVPDAPDLVVDCRGFDGCYGSLLEHELQNAGRDRILLAGYACEVTVDSTVRTLNDRGFECLVVVDACAPLDPYTGAHAHASLTMSGGIFGALASTSEVVALLSKLTPAPEET
jgi:nicotinamidase-related amidase